MFKHLSRRFTFFGVLLAALWMGVSKIADSRQAHESIKKYVEDISASVQKIDPWTMREAFLHRLGCADDGSCEQCQTTAERISTVDCGPTTHFLPVRDEDVNHLLPLLAMPVAVLYSIKVAWAGGLFGFLVALSSVVLGFTILIRPTREKPQGGNPFGAFWLGMLLGGLLIILFKWVLLGILAIFGYGAAFLAALSYVLYAFEFYLKVGHADELWGRLTKKGSSPI